MLGDNYAPRIEVAIYARGEVVSHLATIDSGASVSSFPYSTALALGIHRDELVRTKHGVSVPGRQDKPVESWKARHIAIQGQLIRVPATGAEEFGPRFQLEPIFIRDPRWFVLGRDDFFRSFTVMFPAAPHRNAVPKFVLDY
jgi:hypothetical protein